MDFLILRNNPAPDRRRDPRAPPGAYALARRARRPHSAAPARGLPGELRGVGRRDARELREEGVMRLSKRQFEALETLADGEWRRLASFSCHRHTLTSLLMR